MKTIKIFAISAMLTLIMCMPVFAAGNGLVAGADGAYYLNGVKVVSQWVDCGTYYGFAGADGKVMANLAISKDVVGEKGLVLTIDQMKGAVTNPVFTVNTSAPAAYLPVNGGSVAPLDSLTPLQRANLEDNYFRRHFYNASFSQYDDETHKAYCACGEWAFAPHSFNSDGKCSACGQKK